MAPELATLAAGLGRELRAAGVPSSPERSVRFARALQLTPPVTRSRLYWTARAVFVSDPASVDAFDAVFARVFDGLVDPADERGDPGAPPAASAVSGGAQPPAPGAQGIEGAGEDVRPSAVASAGGDGEGPEHATPLGAASAAERLASKDFADLAPDELVALHGLMARLSVAPPPRRTRRARRARRGERLDVRATLRAAHRTGGDPVRRVRRRRALEPRRLVVLCDISGSMAPYARAFLTFLHGAVGGADAEAFVFATRLTRLTRVLRASRPDVALARAGAAAPDWSGGTRIGEALRAFNDHYGRRGMARGAVVVIVSDGWETGDAALLTREMARLHRLAYRVVWVNPRKGAPGFAPAAAGMLAALPFCDAFVGGRDLQALSEVVEAIGARR